MDCLGVVGQGLRLVYRFIAHLIGILRDWRLATFLEPYMVYIWCSGHISLLERVVSQSIPHCQEWVHLV